MNEGEKAVEIVRENVKFEVFGEEMLGWPNSAAVAAGSMCLMDL